MPTITKTLSSLTPVAFDSENRDNLSTWFSYVRRVYSLERNGTVIPPTKSEFFKAWNYIYPQYSLSFSGENLEEQKQSLSHCQLPTFGRYLIPRYATEEQREKRIRAITWAKLIIALNAYVQLKRENGYYNILPVDFIGSAGDRALRRNNYDARFNGKIVLHLQDSILNRFIEITKERLNCYNSAGDIDQAFWNYIFEVVDNNIQFTHGISRRVRRTRQNLLYYYHNAPTTTHYTPAVVENDIQEIVTPGITIHIPVSAVDNPSHEIAREYLDRETEEDEDFIPSNQQIAQMIANTSVILPEDIRKTVYEACVAFHMSHAVEPSV